MPQLGPLEILVIFVVALLVFGPSKLPEIGRQVGKGVNEFRRFQQTLRADLDGMLGDHDDQSNAAEPAPTLAPRDPAFTVEPADRETAEAAAGESGEPMLPLPWPDPQPPAPQPPAPHPPVAHPLPPDPEDPSPVDRTP
jgi:TatA/E family protein of Tat protein translocase